MLSYDSTMFTLILAHQTTNLQHTTVKAVQHTDVPSTKRPFSTTLKQATGMFSVMKKSSFS